MADLSQLTANVAQLTENLTKLVNHNKEAQEERQKKDEEMANRMQNLENKMSALTTEAQLSTFSPTLASQNWGPPEMDPSWADRPLTGQETSQLIQLALNKQVKPAVGKIVAKIDHRITATEEDLRSLKMRVSWMEKDMLSQQVQVAKKTIIFRNWPENYTEQDRTLTIHKAIREAGCSTSTVDIYTGFFTDADDKKKLSSNSILTTQTFADRQEIMKTHKDKDATFTACPGWFWKQVNREREKDVERDVDGKKEWVKEKEYYKKWEPQLSTDTIKLAPGITQMERRLEAPLFGMMNAYQKILTQYKGKSFKPYWKSLVLADPNGAWLGQVRYERVKLSQSLNTPSQADFQCNVFVPDELYDPLLEAWADIWYEQLSKQYSQTEDEDSATLETSQQTAEDYSKVIRFTRAIHRSKPAWDDSTDKDVENFVQRFKWEFPWPIVFHKVSKSDPKRQLDRPSGRFTAHEGDRGGRYDGGGQQRG